MQVIFLFFIFVNYLHPHTILAVLPTPTSTPSPTNVPTKAPDEIQKIREVVQQKVREKLKLITQPSATPKGIVGKIIQIDANQFTLEYQNNVRTVKFDDTTVFIDISRNKSKADKLKIGQDLLAMGTFDDSNNLIAKRIINTDLKPITTAQRVVVIGKIVDISKSSPVFALIPSKNKNIQYQIKTDTKTEIVNSTDKKIAVADLKSGQKIITILNPDEKMAKTYYAKKIINLDYQPPITPTITPVPTKKP